VLLFLWVVGLLLVYCVCISVVLLLGYRCISGFIGAFLGYYGCKLVVLLVRFWCIMVVNWLFYCWVIGVLWL
jgi:hypothetical protein